MDSGPIQAKEPAPQQVHPCRGDTTSSNRLYHFGVLLSELVLGQTISPPSDVVNGTMGPDTTSYSSADILLAVNTHPMAKDAIDFCFSRSSDSHWTVDDSRPNQVE